MRLVPRRQDQAAHRRPVAEAPRLRTRVVVRLSLSTQNQAVRHAPRGVGRYELGVGGEAGETQVDAGVDDGDPLPRPRERPGAVPRFQPRVSVRRLHRVQRPVPVVAVAIFVDLEPLVLRVHPDLDRGPGLRGRRGRGRRRGSRRGRGRRRGSRRGRLCGVDVDPHDVTALRVRGRRHRGTFRGSLLGRRRSGRCRVRLLGRCRVRLLGRRRVKPLGRIGHVPAAATAAGRQCNRGEQYRDPFRSHVQPPDRLWRFPRRPVARSGRRGRV